MKNIMNTLTPNPPFDPRKKNEAVKFPPFPPAVGKKAPTKIMCGKDRTVNSIKL